MDAKAELGGQVEDGVVSDLVRDLFVTFPLIAYVDEAMVHAHFEFCWGLVAAALVLIELLQTSECCNSYRKRGCPETFKAVWAHTVHELLLFKRDGEAGILALQVQRENMIARAAIVTFDRQGTCLMLHGEVGPDRA